MNDLNYSEVANRIAVFLYTGQKVNEVSGMNSIKLENLSKGIYFVKVESSKGINYVTKIIKN
jgi:hypothetical protein